MYRCVVPECEQCWPQLISRSYGQEELARTHGTSAAPSQLPPDIVPELLQNNVLDWLLIVDLEANRREHISFDAVRQYILRKDLVPGLGRGKVICHPKYIPQQSGLSLITRISALKEVIVAPLSPVIWKN